MHVDVDGSVTQCYISRQVMQYGKSGQTQ